jgi:hypothetical protein
MMSGAAFVLLEFVAVGGPMLLVDWSRKRRQAAIARQIALTDALDGQLGAVVSPVVTKPLSGPWEIQIAVPLSRLAAVGRILTIVNAVLSGVEGMRERSYRVVLRTTQDTPREAGAPPARRPAKRWAGRPVAAA